MAKLAYDEDLINQSIDQLNDAKRILMTNDGGITSAINTISGARGANYLDLSGLQAAGRATSDCGNAVDDMIRTIEEKKEAVKAYNDEQDGIKWYERIFPTIGMAASKFVEGFFTAGEQIVDGFASAIGWVAGIFGAKGVQESIGYFVKKDHVGDAFHDFYYNTDIGKGMLKYSAMKEDGIAAKVFKIAGTAAGYAAAISVAGSALGVSTTVSAVAPATNSASALLHYAAAVALDPATLLSAGVTAIGGIGSGTQAGLQSGMDYNSAFVNGIKTGAIAGASTIAATALFSTAGAAIKNLRNGAGKGSTALTEYNGPKDGYD